MRRGWRVPGKRRRSRARRSRAKRSKVKRSRWRRLEKPDERKEVCVGGGGLKSFIGKDVLR